MKIKEKLNGLTKAEVEKVLKAEISKSQKVKTLFEAGYEVKDISTLVGISYNFAYNVINNHVLMNGIETEKTKRASRKYEVFASFDEGKTNTETAKELKMAYNQVWKFRKEWEELAVAEAGNDK